MTPKLAARRTISSVGDAGGLPFDSVAKAATSLSPGSSAPSALLLRRLSTPSFRATFCFEKWFCSGGNGSISVDAIFTRANSGGRGECEEDAAVGGPEVFILKGGAALAKGTARAADWPGAANEQGVIVRSAKEGGRSVITSNRVIN
jgi:hypothetical protein